MIEGINESDLKHWIEDSLKNNTNTLAAGYQGKTLLFENDNHHLVIKTPHGRGIVRYLHIRMLRHENDTYKKLKDFEGCPACYGLVDNQYLVLELIDGKPIRNNQPENPDSYFSKMLELVKAMHAHDVAHMDLKKKDNLLVANEGNPCFIDFGAAVIKKPGFHPINTFLFNLARQFDYNAWIKHKYNNNMHNISAEDSAYYQRTFIEKISSAIKKSYTKAFKKHR